MADRLRECRLVFRETVGVETLKSLRLEPGIELVEPQGTQAIRLQYRSGMTGVDSLLPWFAARGLSPAGGLRNRIGLAICCYRDALARQAARDPRGWEASLRRVYVSRQPQRLHGRRDERAQHWRKYLDRNRSA